MGNTVNLCCFFNHTQDKEDCGATLASFWHFESYQGVFSGEPDSPCSYCELGTGNKSKSLDPSTQLGVCMPGNSCFLKFSCCLMQREQTLPTANSYTFRTRRQEFIARICQKENIFRKAMKRFLWKVDTQARENRNKLKNSEQTFHRLMQFLWLFALLNFLKVNLKPLVYCSTPFSKYLKLTWHLVLKIMWRIGKLLYIFT